MGQTIGDNEGRSYNDRAIQLFIYCNFYCVWMDC